MTHFIDKVSPCKDMGLVVFVNDAKGNPRDVIFIENTAEKLKKIRKKEKEKK